MLKKLLIIVICMLMVGCSLNNNPTSKVEELLGRYQGLNVNIDYVDLAGEDNLDKDIVSRYEDLISKQYRNLSYDVKDEVIDGNVATITVEIEVLDFKKEFDDTFLDLNHEMRIERLENVDNKVTYTIDFEVYKDDNGNWKIGSINNEIKKKILGIY